MSEKQRPGEAAEQTPPERSALAVELRLTQQMLAEAREREAKALSQLETALENERAAWEKVGSLTAECKMTP